MCQQEGANLAVINSQQEVAALRFLYFNYGPVCVERGSWDSVISEDGIPPPAPAPTRTPERANAINHDVFIAGVYLTVHGM